MIRRMSCDFTVTCLNSRLLLYCPTFRVNTVLPLCDGLYLLNRLYFLLLWTPSSLLSSSSASHFKHVAYPLLEAQRILRPATGRLEGSRGQAIA